MNGNGLYDLAVIGGGPGGYTAAIRGAQQGLKVLLVEKDAVGGTCLNRGCIPTKSYVYDTKTFESALKAKFLRGKEGLELDLPMMVERKRNVVKTLVGGLGSIIASHGIEIVRGKGSLLGPGKLGIRLENGSEQEAGAGNIVIATGSRPSVPSFIHVDGKIVQTTDEALDPESIPNRMVIIGGGVIGIEMATIYRRLGSEVVVIELLEDILMTEDREIRQMTRELMERSGILFHLKSKVEDVAVRDHDALIKWKDASGETQQIECDRVLVAVGRSPFAGGIESTQLKRDMDGPFIRVTPHMATCLPGVWAIGDVVGGMMLAHKASAEAEVVIENILGGNRTVDEMHIPSCIWGVAEIGSVGMSEDEAMSKGREFRVGRFPYSYSGAAMALGETEGLAKIIADSMTGEVLGAHILGPHATDLIGEVVGVMASEGVVEDLMETIHPHPTLSEILMEAAGDWGGMAIHAPKKSRL